MTTDELLKTATALLSARDSALALRQAELFGEKPTVKDHHAKFMREKFAEAAALLGYQIIECDAADLQFSR